MLVVNNNCYYYRYFNAFPNAAKLKCILQLITALWYTGKLMQILKGKAVESTLKHTLFLLRRETILLATIIGRIDNFMIVIWWQGDKFAGGELYVSWIGLRFTLFFNCDSIASWVHDLTPQAVIPGSIAGIGEVIWAE